MDEAVDIGTLSDQSLALTAPADNAPILLDLDKGTSVILGVPVERKAVKIPDQPHVFIAHTLDVTDRDHTTPVRLKDTVVLIGHARRNGDTWVFGNGDQGVVETYRAYNDYATINGLPSIEFIAACNADIVAQESRALISDLGVPNTVAQAVGSHISVAGTLELSGSSSVFVNSPEPIFHLDTLQTVKDIKVES